MAIATAEQLRMGGTGTSLSMSGISYSSVIPAIAGLPGSQMRIVMCLVLSRLLLHYCGRVASSSHLRFADLFKQMDSYQQIASAEGWRHFT